ncbi:MAG: nucleotidyltransferase domain-containing protein [Acidimicrobiales bacterium]
MNPDLDVGRRWLAANGPPGRVVLCAVTGSHLYGFPSPDSDLDLNGIHLGPTRELLGLGEKSAAHDAVGWSDGIECDLTTNEVGDAIRLLLHGNGNMLERILSPWQLVTGTEIGELAGLAHGCLSRRFANHYGGFFRGRCAEHERHPTAKSLLYSWRVALTGRHLLRAGELVADLGLLADLYARPELHDLIDAKRDGGEHCLPPADLDRHLRALWPELGAALTDAENQSSLPYEANRPEIEEWVVRGRIAGLDSYA